MGKDAGSRIGRYVIDRRLGAGGMAEAYLAHQEGLGGFTKPVVIKVMHPWRTNDADTVASFLREARLGASLNHVHIVQIFDVGEDRGEHFIAMEYVDGLTLQQAARRCWGLGEGLPVDVAVRVGTAAALALDYAHTTAGIIHRDVSPDNIMIARDGTVKLLDFGVAKIDGSDATRAGEVKGKVPFLSPEQLTGHTIDARADLWSLGVTLYWCLTGRRPFQGDNDLATMRAIVEDRPPSLRARCPAASPALETLVMRLLERDRDKRVPTAAALADELADLAPPARTSPVASFIARMRSFDDDSPEKRRATGGYPAVKLPASDQTEVGPMPVDPESTGSFDSGPGTGSGVFSRRVDADEQGFETNEATEAITAPMTKDPDVTEEDGAAAMLQPQRSSSRFLVLGALALVVVVVAAVVAVVIAVTR